MSNEHEVFLKMEEISKSFPGVKALSDVSFAVKQGEIHALIGGNGAGKSTLMKILAGVYTKDSGSIYVNGKQVEIGSPRNAEALGISIIHQELTLLPSLTVAENIYLGRQPRDKMGLVNWKRMNRDASILLERLGITISAKSTVGELSVAQQQLVEIAKAMSIDAKIMIMDEPTSSLTTKEISLLFSIIRTLKKRGVAVIYISHRLEEIFEICERVTIMRDGHYVGDYATAEITKSELISLMIGRDMGHQFPPRSVQFGDEILRVENLSGLTKIRDISFSVRRGEVLGFAGLVGAGRTEVMRLLFGVEKKKSGQVYLHGKSVSINRPLHAIRNRIGFVTEDRKNEGLILSLPLRINCTMVAKDKILKYGLVNKAKEQNIAKRFVEDLSIITPSINQKVMHLSGGNQQKVVLAKWLLSDSDIMILDEPTRGIDVGAKYDIYEIINALAEKGCAIIVISSESEELMGICDRIIVMSEGRITGELVKGDYSHRKITEYAVGSV